MIRSRILLVALLTLPCASVEAADLSDVRLHCRGARTLVDDEGRTAFHWVERSFDVDFGAGEVLDPAGGRIASQITDELIRLEIELAGWPPGRVRLVTIDRASGAWSARPLEPGAALDETKGTCLRLAG